VPRRGAAGPAAATSGGAAAAGPVHLNSATLEQLDALPGVGPVTAQKILVCKGGCG
jgi:competence protein ComEA